MNDGYGVSIRVPCLCCGELYMRNVEGMQAAKDAVDGLEACPKCVGVINGLLALCRSRPPWTCVQNRLDPYE
jgi:hypothetical protein